MTSSSRALLVVVAHQEQNLQRSESRKGKGSRMLFLAVYLLCLLPLGVSFVLTPSFDSFAAVLNRRCLLIATASSSSPSSLRCLSNRAIKNGSGEWMSSSKTSLDNILRSKIQRSCDVVNLCTTHLSDNFETKRKRRDNLAWERWLASATLGFMLLLPLAIAPAANAFTPDTTLLPSPVTVETRPGVLDEVWRLVSKYYIDKTYNGKDWNAIRERYESQDTTVEDTSRTMSLAKSMISNLGDKYSRILDKEAYEQIQKFDLIGVGATLIGNDSKQIMVGGPPIRGSAADRAGLQAGDYIMSVNGVPTQGRTSFDIIDQVNEGTPPSRTITFTVAKGGDTSNMLEIELERSFVEVSNPITYKLDARDRKHKVGYVRIREFNSLVNPKIREALLDLESQGANAFVIDLRSNPGGAFQSAVDVASLFMENKVATYFVDGNNVKTPFTTSSKNVVVDEVDPIVIWIDRGSASASEVFTGAMHDNCRAIVMGDRSFGKGLIQSVFGLENGSGLVLTVAQYITPNGSVIQGSGISPDIQAKLPMRIPLIGSGSDTSVVDFHQVSDLQSKLCSTTSSTSTMARVMDDRR